MRIGADLALGGAITWLSHRERPDNLVNSYDLGRQIQMSHYSGPIPFQPQGTVLKEEWKGIGWNPIQTGDVFGHASRVLAHRNDGHELYVKCVPMHWPLENVPGECLFEIWITLDGPSAHLRFRATNARPDTTRYPARQQELPAVYLVSALHRFMAYTGEQPFTGGALTHITNDFRKPWPWAEQICTEAWAALVGDDDWGVGLAQGDNCLFHGGLYGEPGSRDVRAAPTAYLAPVRRETFDHDLVYEYTTVLTLGRLDEIRARLNARAARDLPAWRFAHERAHWHVVDGTDAGPPRAGAWIIPVEQGAPQVVGPVRCWRAEDGPEVVVDAAWTGGGDPARLRWRTLGDQAFDDHRSVAVAIPNDGAFHRVVVPLAGHAAYRGLITGLRLDPPPAAPGAELRLRAIVVQRPR